MGAAVRGKAGPTTLTSSIEDRVACQAAQPGTRAGHSGVHRRATPYWEWKWGDYEIYVYRGCMVEHGQPEQNQGLIGSKKACDRGECGAYRVSHGS
jgi:hypothetical protein